MARQAIACQAYGRPSFQRPEPVLTDLLNAWRLRLYQHGCNMH